MKPLPWSWVKSWRCLRCGVCCQLIVQLTMKEWLDISKTYSSGLVQQQIDGFYLRKTIDGRCPFLLKSSHKIFCGIQRMKPLACKIWPFKILTTPKYGRSNEASFRQRGMQFYIYVNPQCPGISWGKSLTPLFHKILPELVDIRLGVQRAQFYSTSKLHLLS